MLMGEVSLYRLVAAALVTFVDADRVWLICVQGPDRVRSGRTAACFVCMASSVDVHGLSQRVQEGFGGGHASVCQVHSVVLMMITLVYPSFPLKILPFHAALQARAHPLS